MRKRCTSRSNGGVGGTKWTDQLHRKRVEKQIKGIQEESEKKRMAVRLVETRACLPSLLNMYRSISYRRKCNSNKPSRPPNFPDEQLCCLPVYGSAGSMHFYQPSIKP